MSAPRRVLLVLGAALAAGCSKSSSSGSAPPVLATQVIGPDGGVVIVQSGSQRGLVLTVPPGAVADPTVFQVTEPLPILPAPGGGIAVTAPLPGAQFRIEPSELILDVNATLRAPYSVPSDRVFGPGNVRVRQESPFVERIYDPENVDVVDGWVEVRIKTFGDFQVVQPDPLPVPEGYVPVVGATTMLPGGFAFAVEDASASLPSATEDATAWHLIGPGFDEKLLFDGHAIVGRESQIGSWREVWSQAYSPFNFPEVALSSMQSYLMQVEAPIGGGLLGASVLPLGFRQFAEPMAFDGRLLLDVLKVTLDVSFNRPDAGVGERRLAFWFAPEEGLVRVSIDGVNYDAIP